MKVLVTGATGFLARYVVPQLLEECTEVVATARGPRPDWLAAEAGYVRADLTSDPLDELVGGVGLVIHLAGASSSRSTEEEMALVNVAGTARLADAVVSGAPGARFVYVSSTSVYGEKTPLPLPVREDGPLLPSRPYGKTKLAAEAAVWEAVGRGLRALVVRPVSVYGPYNIKLVASAILDASIERDAGFAELELSEPAVELRLVHGDDAARALVHLGIRSGDEVLGRAFNLSSPEFPTSHQVGSAIAAALGMAPRITTPPPASGSVGPPSVGPPSVGPGSVGPGSGSAGLADAERREVRDRLVADGRLDPEILLSPRRLAFLTRPNPNNRLSLDALSETGFVFEHTDLDAEIVRLVAWYTDHRWIA